MRVDRRAVVVTLFLMLLVGTASPLSRASSSLCSQSEAPAVVDAPGRVDTNGWRSYEDPEYGFQVKYPPGFISTNDASELVATGAVVRFVPTFDPSIDKAGAKTNLHHVSVTIGVTDASVALSQADASASTCADAHAYERGLSRPIDVGGIRFAKSCLSEGAVGNRYETLSYRATYEGKRYEIALFVHYGSLDCYSPGAIVIFDRTEILRLFDTMVGTFLTSTRDDLRP